MPFSTTGEIRKDHCDATGDLGLVPNETPFLVK